MHLYLQCTAIGPASSILSCFRLTSSKKSRTPPGSVGTPWSGQALKWYCQTVRSVLPWNNTGELSACRWLEYSFNDHRNTKLPERWDWLHSIIGFCPQINVYVLVLSLYTSTNLPDRLWTVWVLLRCSRVQPFLSRCERASRRIPSVPTCRASTLRTCSVKTHKH